MGSLDAQASTLEVSDISNVRATRATEKYISLFINKLTGAQSLKIVLL